MKTLLVICILSVVCGMPTSICMANVRIAAGGKAKCVILTQIGATAAELHAANELAKTLQQITGAAIPVQQAAGSAPASAIVVGPGPLAASLFPEVALNKFGGEQLVMRTSRGRLLLAGGRARGTLYAVYRFLYTQCGVRWWTPWAATIPHTPDLSIADLAVDEKPAFESRDPYWFPAFDPDWAVRNMSNSEHAHLDDARGGAIRYNGFVHTFYPLVPPAEYSATHPEYYALIDGKRVFSNAQLCTTNPELRDLIVAHIRERILADPGANILSVSQNDCFNPCQCPICKAIDDAQGSYSGTMLTLVNYVAKKIGKEFPNVAIDTLAYQYTRKAPKDIKPLPNVIVRLCSIECNFAAPLDDPSNRKFATDIEDWNRLSKRLYIWDYTTNFAHYVQPHPNWFVLGPNLRFFHNHGAKGVFEQGAYQSSGSEMSEMRAWVLAQLLWNPDQDDTKLIREFLDGYYGRAAAKPIWSYLVLLTAKAKGYYMGCYSPPNSPFLDFPTLSKAEKLWQAAEFAVKDHPDLLWRVRQAHLPVRYVFLQRWPQFRLAALRANAAWPVDASRKAVAAEWLAVATGSGPAGWTPMTTIREGGESPQAFVAAFAVDPPDPTPLPARNAHPAPPPGLSEEDVAAGVDVQEDAARLDQEGVLSEVRVDTQASDVLAAWMPGSHHEWAVQFPGSSLPTKLLKGKWKVYAVVRAEGAANASPDTVAMTMGIWDTSEKRGTPDVRATIAQIGHGYTTLMLGEVHMTTDKYVWLAPTANSAVKSVWVDRLWFVPAKSP